jgi:hypothetical protein
MAHLQAQYVCLEMSEVPFQTNAASEIGTTGAEFGGGPLTHSLYLLYSLYCALLFAQFLSALMLYHSAHQARNKSRDA